MTPVTEFPPVPSLPGRCATCRHWKTTVPNPGVPWYGLCDLITNTVPAEAYLFSTDAAEQGLTTRSDFGCTLHQPIPAPTSPPSD